MKKQLKDIVEGDRILYPRRMLTEKQGRPHEPLSAEVLQILKVAGYIRVRTASGWLHPMSEEVELELVGDDYTKDSQMQYAVNPPETVCGVSIE
jgi:hypothetical protein